MNSQTVDCETRQILEDEQESSCIGKVIFVSRLVIVALAVVLAVVSIWTIFKVG